MEIQMLAGFLALVMMITYLAIHFSSREVDASPDPTKDDDPKRYAIF